jgi:hypothetical protein
MAKLFLDITPSYPLREIEFWRVMVAEAESGKELRTTRWNFPRRDWDLTWHLADRTTEREPILSVLRKTKGGADSFFWKEPRPTTRDDIYIGTGTGSRTTWVLPVWAAESYTLYVNSAIYAAGSQYSVDSYGSANSQHVFLITSPTPIAGEAIHCSYLNGYYTPLVRQLSPFQSSLIPPGWTKDEITLTLREPKEDMPES